MKKTFNPSSVKSNSHKQEEKNSPNPVAVKQENFLLHLKNVANDNRRRHRPDGPGGNYNGY